MSENPLIVAIMRKRRESAAISIGKLSAPVNRYRPKEQNGRPYLYREVEQAIREAPVGEWIEVAVASWTDGEKVRTSMARIFRPIHSPGLKLQTSREERRVCFRLVPRGCK